MTAGVSETIGMSDDTDLYVRGEPQGVFVVVWKKAPTREGLDRALAPMATRFQSSPSSKQAFIIITVAKEPVSSEANRYAAEFARRFARQCWPLAVIDVSGPRQSLANRVALRMILATAGALGLAPLVSMFQKPEEGAAWVAKKLGQSGSSVDEQALIAAVRQMVERCTAPPPPVAQTPPGRSEVGAGVLQ